MNDRKRTRARAATQARIVLTRGELVRMFGKFIDFTRSGGARDFPGFLDRIFAEARRDGSVTFDPMARAGRRFS